MPFRRTVLTACGLALAGSAGIAGTTPPVPAVGVQFDGSYVGQDTLHSEVAFCTAPNLPEQIEVQNGQFAQISVTWITHGEKRRSRISKVPSPSAKQTVLPPNEGDELPMAITVVIIVPSQGHSTGAFLDSAKELREKVYGGKATIVQTTVTPVGENRFLVKFTQLKGKVFSFDDAKNLARVITISHAFSGDGPNLAYEDGGYQPWGTNDDNTALSPGGEAFWENVGHALTPNGLIILLGCFMGSGNYAKLVAQASERAVYASTSLFAAGNATTAIKYVNAIEHGKVLAPMTKIGRPVTGFSPAPAHP